MRLIDADALIQKRNHAKAYAQDMYVIGQGYVMDAPTFDAVPVVRCGECKYYHAEHGTHYMCGKNRFIEDGVPRNPNDYCSYGEKMEEAFKEKQERDKGCVWCNPNPYGHGEAIRPLISQVFNDKAQISTMISGDGLHTLAVPSPEDTNLAKRYSKCQIIHFCPMCGKRLEEHHEAD